MGLCESAGGQAYSSSYPSGLISILDGLDGPAILITSAISNPLCIYVIVELIMSLSRRVLSFDGNQIQAHY